MTEEIEQQQLEELIALAMPYLVEVSEDDKTTISNGLRQIEELYQKSPATDSDNYRNLLFTYAGDIKTVIVKAVGVLKQLRESENKDAAREAAYLYAPLVHQLGLYNLKRELEDYSLKYLEHDAYYHIKDKLHETKTSRDAYIQKFVQPIEKALMEAGLRFHIKARTKSIHSIWQKMKKQKVGVDGIYDLFAIRIIIDAPLEKEKMMCWQAYSIVTDMYTPNTKRLRDWLSVPKSNGYESLHITVLGPDERWVEVQIRTERMDDVAENGIASHWSYKGLKGNSANDNNVYVFTPKGDLLKFPTGSTLLDFAFRIHSNVGNHCTGGIVNGKNVTIRYALHSGDEVEIVTSNTQTPKQEWLKIATTTHARGKIRQSLNELESKASDFAKELISRRFRNRKIELEETLMGRLVKKLGYKEVTMFYRDIADEKLDINDIIERYQELQNPEKKEVSVASASTFQLNKDMSGVSQTSGDELVIDRNLKGIEYQLAKCCKPIYGDDIFAFVTATGGIKIHRKDCPNAKDMKERFGYRILRARWSGKGTSQYCITLRVIGNDDIGIVNNLTSVISGEEKMMLRSINIDSDDGLFRGNLEVMIEDTSRLETLLRKLRNIKGIKHVERI